MNKPILREFLHTNFLLALDYDGTLAPIVRDPARAHMRKSTWMLLREVAGMVPTVVISGRARKDTLGFLKGIPLREIVGNHGIEPWRSTAKIQSEVKRIKESLMRTIPKHQGLVLEDKKYSLSVHYRRSRKKKAARELIHNAIAPLSKVRVIRGKQVVNIIPQDGPHKGIALLNAMRKFRCDTAIYIGDDETDEDVFNLKLSGELLSVRVSKREASAADYYIASQSAIDGFLKFVISAARRNNV